MKNLGFGTRAIHHRPAEPTCTAARLSADPPDGNPSRFDDLGLDGGRPSAARRRAWIHRARKQPDGPAASKATIANWRAQRGTIALGSGCGRIHAVLAGNLPGRPRGRAARFTADVCAPHSGQWGRSGSPRRSRSDRRQASPTDHAEDAPPSSPRRSRPAARRHGHPVLARIAHAAKARLMVDATFTTPYLSRRLEMGADMWSTADEVLGGHANVNRGRRGAARKTHGARQEGGGPRARRSRRSTRGCWLRGIATRRCAWIRHCRSALAVASALDGHAQVSSCATPAPKHPAYGTSSLRAIAQARVIGLELVGGARPPIEWSDSPRAVSRAGLARRRAPRSYRCPR